MGHEASNCGSDKTINAQGVVVIELSVGIESPPQGNMLHVSTADDEHLTMAQWLTLRASAANPAVSTADWCDDLEDKSPVWYGRVFNALSGRGMLAGVVKQRLRDHAKRYHGFTYPDPA
jgi:hypothetical protein